MKRSSKERNMFVFCQFCLQFTTLGSERTKRIVERIMFGPYTKYSTCPNCGEAAPLLDSDLLVDWRKRVDKHFKERRKRFKS